ncbi:hypothetical protein C1752_00388 [Acaryochloris thomasi RCC1774]|uniref:Calcineurin-like phosphoesterase domain-containing protein n=1 Tax=Acaryochloris thomasi RCC1774 TaxID=1764569 RepID=A0A2W1JPI6_9CYAN|nr:hypothetical protein [Acaryochloris thomasi]PZD75156.1 hypothetical protein C1752_00388 [Acaryochloris thomasi RCC1774]
MKATVTKPLLQRFGLSLLLWVVLLPTRIQAQSFRFIAVGDMPYSPQEQQVLDREIKDAISSSQAPFVVHYGDFKGGGETCSEALFTARRNQMYGLLPGRVFYTPGDNDWTDCDRPFLKAPISELDQLDLMRRLFFHEPLDLPESWAYARQPNFPENGRWQQNDVVFTTLHIVGTNNGRQEILLDDPELALSLVEARDQANRVWLQAAFDEAEDAQALVVIVQADVTDPDGSGACTAFHRMNCDAFANFRDQLMRLAANFREQGKPAKPVLLVHGDTNPFCLDKNFGGEMAPNLWRLNAWGDFQSPPDATEITVQPSIVDEPFTVKTLLRQNAPTPNCH